VFTAGSFVSAVAPGIGEIVGTGVETGVGEGEGVGDVVGAGVAVGGGLVVGVGAGVGEACAKRLRNVPTTASRAEGGENARTAAESDRSAVAATSRVSPGRHFLRFRPRADRWTGDRFRDEVS